MKLAFSSISALDRPLAEAAQLAAEVGLDGLEVCERAPHMVSGCQLEVATAAGLAVQAAGLEVVAFGSYLGREAPAGPEAAAHAVACAAAMEAPLLRVWAEPAAGEGDRGRVVELLQSACDAAAVHGIQVVVERHVGSFADTPEHIEALLADVGRNNFALNYQVLDLIAPDEADAQPADAAALAARARYFHLKNFRPNLAGGPLLPGGSLAGGVLDYRAILAAAFDAGYTGPLAIEFLSWEPLPIEEKLAADAAYVRELLAELGHAKPADS
jgi:sugar phosphate isomerase/epimerase